MGLMRFSQCLLCPAGPERTGPIIGRSLADRADIHAGSWLGARSIARGVNSQAMGVALQPPHLASRKASMCSERMRLHQVRRPGKSLSGDLGQLSSLPF